MGRVETGDRVGSIEEEQRTRSREGESKEGSKGNPKRGSVVGKEGKRRRKGSVEEEQRTRSRERESKEGSKGIVQRGGSVEGEEERNEKESRVQSRHR